MSPRRRHALTVARETLHGRRGLHGLSGDERAAVEALAASIAVQVADAIDAALAGAVYSAPTSSRARAVRESIGS
jgi:hypothetical protein